MIKKKLLLLGNGKIGFQIDRFDIMNLKKYFQIYYFDCSEILYKNKILPQKKKNINLKEIFIKKIIKKAELINQINLIRPDFVIDGIQSDFTKTLKKKTKFKFKFIIWLDGLVNWNKSFFYIINFYSLKSKIKLFLNKIYKLINYTDKLYIYDIGFFAGDESKKLIDFQNTKKIYWIGSNDFYKNINKKKVKNEKKYVTYIDSNLYLGGEMQFNSMNKVPKLIDLKSHLDNTFNKIEELTNIEVKILAHPNPKLLKTYNYSDLYGNRKVYENKTVELIKKSKLILSDYSTAINFAVLNYKPLILMYSNQLNYSQYQKMLIANYQLLNANLFNSDEINENFKINYDVNYKKYNSFIKLFINNFNSANKYKTSKFIKEYC